MGSRQAAKAENIEAAARLAVDKLRDVSRNEDQEQVTRTENQSHDQQEQQKGSGFLGGILKSAGETYEQVKGSITGSTIATDDRSRTQGVNDVPQKNEAAKDSVMDKAVEYKDYTSEKAKEEKDAASGRMSEMMENAAIAARRTMDHITGRKEDISDDIAQQKYGKTEPEARKAMQEVKLKEEGVHDEEKQRARADWDTAADRGMAARSTIYGAMGLGTIKDAIKDKLTSPTDIVHEARASQEYGGPKRGRGEKLVDDVEEGPSGPAAMPSAKASG